jgi:hypothetical protein
VRHVIWKPFAISAPGALQAVSQSQNLLTFAEKKRIHTKYRLAFFHITRAFRTNNVRKQWFFVLKGNMKRDIAHGMTLDQERYLIHFHL